MNTFSEYRPRRTFSVLVIGCVVAQLGFAPSSSQCPVVTILPSTSALHQEDAQQESPQVTVAQQLVWRGWQTFRDQCADARKTTLPELTKGEHRQQKKLSALVYEFNRLVDELQRGGLSDNECKTLLEKGDAAKAIVGRYRKGGRSVPNSKTWSKLRNLLLQCEPYEIRAETATRQCAYLANRAHEMTWPAFSSERPKAFGMAALAREVNVIGSDPMGMVVEIIAHIDALDGKPVKSRKMTVVVASGLEWDKPGKVQLPKGTVVVTQGPVSIRLAGEMQMVQLVHLAVLPKILKMNGKSEQSQALLANLPEFEGSL